MEDLESVDILGVPVSCLNQIEIFNLVRSWCRGQKNKRSILYVNAHCLNIAVEDKNFPQILSRADLILPDGISVVWSARLFGQKHLQKKAAIGWIEEFLRFAVDNKLSLYVIAGKPGVAQQAVVRMQEILPGLKVTGVSDGYFLDKDEENVIKEINEQLPEIVFVGMGSPIQETWIIKNRERINAPVCWAVGALFDYIAGVESRVPGWMNKMGLEWLWRLRSDPKGKWKRYLIGNPLFVYRVLRQWFILQ